MRDDFELDGFNCIKEKLGKKYPTLTKSDLIWRHGNRVEWLGMIASKLGKTLKELKREIDFV
ncbi:MAG: general stress protein CsbD [Bacteroidales bacterium]|nr:general stress protein CsbD [Bacteroidales bacterium]